MSGTKRMMQVAMAVVLMGVLSACSNQSATRQTNMVAQAYDSSGTLAGLSYSRTIFSTTDF